MLAACVDPTLEVRGGSDRLTVRDRQPVVLTGRELEMWLLKTHPGTGYTREELRERVLGRSFQERSTVTVHVRRLPERVEPGRSRTKRPRTARVSSWSGVAERWCAGSGPGRYELEPPRLRASLAIVDLEPARPSDRDLVEQW